MNSSFSFNNNFEPRHKQYLTGISVWAMAFGGVIGWGAFVMPGTNFLQEAGPLGTVLGLAIAAIVCFVICANYSWMVQQFPESGGSYMFTRHILGEDHAFLAVWSLELAYISLLWANTTAFALMFRYIFGDILQWGFHYVLADYDVYIGEVVVSLLIEIFFGLITTYYKKLADILRTVFAVALLASVVILFVGVIKNSYHKGIFIPHFSTGEPKGIQILNVAILAPWLFVGFETVTHSVGEIRFPVKKIFAYAAAAIFAGMMVYMLLVLTAAASAPEPYTNWSEYIEDIPKLKGRLSMPVFYNAEHAMGKLGLVLVSLAAFSALITSVLGFHRAVARVLRVMASAGLLPESFSKVNKDGLPVKASLLVLLISLPMPFLGRAVIGWNSDVSTLSVSIVYAYISICTFKTAGKNKKATICGVLGVVFAILVFFFLLIPNVFAENLLVKESYFMLAMWSLLGILYYWLIFKQDRKYRYGQSTIMWVMMLFLLFFSANVWVRLQEQSQIENANNDSAIIHSVLMHGSLMQLIVIVIALFIMFNLFVTMLKREKELDFQIIQAEERNKAKSDFLSNMSHDIRTPMNAIIGFTNLALQSTDDGQKTKEYLSKIKVSSDHLLSLINDVLEMSRIESGKIELEETLCNLPDILHNLNTIIIAQVEAKQQELHMDALNVVNENIYCDRLRLNQVLLNLLSNAVKYTPSGGKISVRIAQFDVEKESENADKFSMYEIRVKDNGIGMSKEFAKTVFESFTRERNSTVSGIQGTGLGMAITKSIVDLMGGTITVNTEQGKGSEFIVRVKFRIADKNSVLPTVEELNNLHALVVDDDFDTCDSTTKLLASMGVRSEWTLSGKEAVLRAKHARDLGDDYKIFLIDWKLADLNGIEVARQIRAELGSDVLILLITAYDWPSIKDEAVEAGVNGFCNKPLFRSELQQSLLHIIGKDDNSTEKQTTKDSINEENFAGKRLLLVDDVSVNREIAVMVLEMHGFSVDQSCDGKEAVEILEKADSHYYDAVLMDIQMPIMNGYEASRAIRAMKDSVKANIPIIAMTANAFDEDRRNALDAGMNAYIAKPIDEQKLIEVLSQVL